MGPILHQQSDTAHPIPFTLVLSSDHNTGASGKTPAIKISKNGGSALTPSGTAAEISSGDMPGEYKFTPSAGDVDTLGSLKLYITAADCDPVSLTLIVVPFDPYSATRGFTGTALPTVATGNPGAVAVTNADSHVDVNVQQWIGNDVPNLVGGDNGYVPVHVASFASNALTGAALAADAGTEIAAAVWAATSRTLTAGASFVVQTQQFEQLEVVRGNSYDSASRSLTVQIRADSVWPTDLSDGWTWAFTAGKHASNKNTAATTTFTGTITVVTATGDSREFRISLVAADIADALGAYDFAIRGTKTGSKVWDAVLGTLLVRDSAAE